MSAQESVMIAIFSVNDIEPLLIPLCLKTVVMYPKSKTPRQTDGASSLQHGRAAGFLTLAAFVKPMLCIRLTHCPQE